MELFYFQTGFGHRSYWGTFDPLFPDCGYSGPESEIADFAGRKTNPNIPFWLAELLFYGLEDWEMERRPVLGIWNSPQNR